MKHLIILVLALTSANIFSQDKAYSIDTIEVKSEILKEHRSIIVFKPANITKADSISFIYLIDGEYSNDRFKKLKERYKDSISNVIAVGIVNTDRRRDLLYVKQADKFLDFITSELIPFVEKDYSTKKRVLYGHSFGGGFTMYAMINKPDYFDVYIASSPTPIMDLIQKDRYLRIDSISKNKIVFNLSYGSEDLRQVSKWSQRLKNNLATLQLTNIDWRFVIFEGKNHNNSDIDALLNGLRPFVLK
jgi:predicted alpha/beta superfamily hydrolase